MPPMEHYPALKHLHLTLVTLSVAGFVLRWLAVLRGAAWPLQRGWRVGTAALDTLLLASGAALWVLLGLHPVHQPWLGVKLLWLLGYIVCGSLALKRAHTPGGKRLAGLAALSCVALMAATALTHHPMPWSAP
jgi:uncharacterized membrane protein SirB2